MISQESIKELAVKYQTIEFPNIVREYFQHLFLSNLYKLESSDNLLFKGGTALRIVYGSPRFSEDLDFSLFRAGSNWEKFIDSLFNDVLLNIVQVGIKVDLGRKPGATTEGYYGDAEFQIYEYPPVSVVINISRRDGRNIKGEVDSISNDFVPTYNVFHLPQDELVDEKIFGALLNRHKARDFYDFYWVMRKGLLNSEQKRRLREHGEVLLSLARTVDFKSELSAFLPFDQHAVIANFQFNFDKELKKQLAV